MKHHDLTKEKIIPSLIFLALPIMGTSFINMAYNITDIIWIGKLGTNEVAAVGTVGFLMWLAFGIALIAKIGAEVLVAQSVGRKDDKTEIIVENTLKLSAIMALIYSAILLLFGEKVLLFFNLKEQIVFDLAKEYLFIIAFVMPFSFLNLTFTSIFNGYGKSKTPFYFNVAGLILNIVLDPILIHGIWIFPKLGVRGAAIATLISNIIVSLIFIIFIIKNNDNILFKGFKFFRRLNISILKNVFKIGLPSSLQSILFTFIAMILARIIAQYGSVAIGVQKIGVNIESITWMTASGFATATSAFVGQNFGANDFNRIKKGYLASLSVMTIIGIFTTALLILIPEPLFKLFINDPESIRQGIVYLQILGISQIAMCIENVTIGAFNGISKTIYPAVNSVIFNFLRIPLALYFTKFMGLSGVWWAITISSILKGVSIFILFIIIFKKEEKIKKISINTKLI